MSLYRCYFVLCVCLAVSATNRAAVVNVEVAKRSVLGTTGYEQIIGRLHFEADPTLPCNAIIADLGLAPVNTKGRVSFSSDFLVFKPIDPARSNGAAWVEIPNRGGKTELSKWIVKQGFTVLNVGWEFDLPAQSNKLRIKVPTARNKDGSPIRGVVSSTFTTDKRTDEQTLTDLADYPPVDVNGPESRLIVRQQMAYPKGNEIPRKLWSLRGNRIRLEGGFEPGRIYEIFYLAEAPPVAGLGYAAIRDAVAWLKHGPNSLAPVKHAYAYGNSQCGRFLRDFVYLGFNTDERDRLALDGIMACKAGAGRLVLNQRWSTPRGLAAYDTASYPFADKSFTDPVSGHGEGILDNPRVKHAPKIFYVNTDTEYWGIGRVAALTHTTPDGTKDIAFPENVRSYFIAGTQHGPAKFPPISQAKGAPLQNPVDPSPVITSLRLAMHRWVTRDITPPPSVYPKLSSGTLIPVKDIHFPKVPGMGDPRLLKAGGRVRNPRWSDGAGEGTKLPLLVPQVDSDGNDVVGIRLPGVAVPLGTATGWVFRPAAMGSPNEPEVLRGAWIPFTPTKARREATRDPRRTVKERYATKEAYLAQVTVVLKKLINQRFLSEEDFAPQLQQAGERWNWVMRDSAQ